LLAKDLRAELRTKVALSAVGLFSFASLLLLALTTAGLKDAMIVVSGDTVRPAWDAQSKMGMLWVLLCFAAFAGLSHSFVHEEETGTVSALRLSMSAEAVYAGKLLLNLLILFGVAVTVTPTYMLMTGMPVGSPGVFALLMFSGCLGLGGTATIVAALTAKARGSGALFGAIGLPLLVVFLILLLNAARTLYTRDAALVRIVKDVGGLLSFGISIVALSAVLFHFVWEE
jgi:ABC-type transport system involved in cytochrome c biogenesis permease component